MEEKKSIWKIVTVLVAVTLLATMILLSVPGQAEASPTGAYNRQAAYDYAQKYWDEVCSDGYFWDTPRTYISLESGTDIRGMPGYDCAHFVSCCIGNETGERGGGLDVLSRVPPTYGEPGAAKLADWLIESGSAVEKTAIDELEKGDVINYDWEGDELWNHVALYLGDGKVAAHTSCFWEADWQLGGAEEYRFIHITAIIRITNESGNELEPDQSNDGQYIVMRSNRDGGTYNIWRMDSHGKNFVKLTDMPSSGYSIQRSAWNPVFHHDGEYVYYMDNSPSGADYHWFCRTPTDGTGGREQILLIPGGEGGGRLSFSPNGSQFAYHHWGYDENHVRSGRQDIKICNSDGSDLKSIYRNDNISGDVAWSTDGTCIYFSMTNDRVVSLYSIGIDAKNLIRLTEPSLGNCTQPALSPNGTKICFQNKKSQESDFELYLMSSDGSNIQQLTNNDFNDISPTWSYDENMVIYSSNVDGDYDFYAIIVAPLSVSSVSICTVVS